MRDSLSRLGGGIGTRGPGEKKLEIDRRVIRGQDLQTEGWRSSGTLNPREASRESRDRGALCRLWA